MLLTPPPPRTKHDNRKLDASLFRKENHEFLKVLTYYSSDIRKLTCDEEKKRQETSCQMRCCNLLVSDCGSFSKGCNQQESYFHVYMGRQLSFTHNWTLDDFSFELPGIINESQKFPPFGLTKYYSARKKKLSSLTLRKLCAKMKSLEQKIHIRTFRWSVVFCLFIWFRNGACQPLLEAIPQGFKEDAYSHLAREID